MTTDLARAWEKDEQVRANARRLQAVPQLNRFPKTNSRVRYTVFLQVKMVRGKHNMPNIAISIVNPVHSMKLLVVIVIGKVVTRDGLCRNQRCLIHGINFLSSRVSMNVVYMHLMSLYSFMEIPIDSGKAAVKFLVN